jgi:hypothetical protein
MKVLKWIPPVLLLLLFLALPATGQQGGGKGKGGGGGGGGDPTPPDPVFVEGTGCCLRLFDESGSDVVTLLDAGDVGAMQFGWASWVPGEDAVLVSTWDSRLLRVRYRIDGGSIELDGPPESAIPDDERPGHGVQNPVNGVIAFEAFDAQGTCDDCVAIRLYDPVSQVSAVLIEESGFIYQKPSWSSSGTKLAFSRQPDHSAPGSYSIVVVDFDWELGNWEFSEYRMEEFEGIHWPSFAWTKDWIAFSATPLGTDDRSIYLLDLTAAEPQVIEIVPGGFLRPTFSPIDGEVAHMAESPKGKKQHGLWITDLVTKNTRFVFSKGTHSSVVADWKW